jgi:hypothetical protein
MYHTCEHTNHAVGRGAAHTLPSPGKVFSVGVGEGGGGGGGAPAGCGARGGGRLGRIASRKAHLGDDQRVIRGEHSRGR